MEKDKIRFGSYLLNEPLSIKKALKFQLNIKIPIVADIRTVDEI